MDFELTLAVMETSPAAAPWVVAMLLWEEARVLWTSLLPPEAACRLPLPLLRKWGGMETLTRAAAARRGAHDRSSQGGKVGVLCCAVLYLSVLSLFTAT
jgi:hypothetical protein